MADYGRVSAVIAEAAATGAAADAKGRVSSVIVEAAIGMEPTARVSSVIVEAAITPPATDPVGRVSAVIAEVVATEVDDVARVAFLFVSVFSEAPTTTPAKRSSFGGGVQGKKVSSLRRR